MDSTIRGTAARTKSHPAVVLGVRFGYAASGVRHLVLGWLAVTLAWGTSTESADQNGALEQLGVPRWEQCCCG